MDEPGPCLVCSDREACRPIVLGDQTLAGLCYACFAGIQDANTAGEDYDLRDPSDEFVTTYVDPYLPDDDEQEDVNDV